MTTNRLNWDPDDIEDWLVKVEKSFGVEFAPGELSPELTFGELCERVSNKIELHHSDSCTTQQAFYKLRTAIAATFGIDNITPKTLLADVLPRKRRISKTKQLESKLGFKLFILQPPFFVVIFLAVLFLASFTGLGGGWQVGLPAFLLSLVGCWVAGKLGKELNTQTVGELAEKIAREHYLHSRRDSTTVNKNEIKSILTDWLSHDLGLDKSKLTDDVKLV